MKRRFSQQHGRTRRRRTGQADDLVAQGLRGGERSPRRWRQLRHDRKDASAAAGPFKIGVAAEADSGVSAFVYPGVYPGAFCSIRPGWEIFNKSLRHRRKCNSPPILVRFTPNSGHLQCKTPCPLSANSGHQRVYSITASARADKPGDTSTPICFAVFRLMMNSNLVDCSTGRSAGFAPLRMRITKSPACR